MKYGVIEAFGSVQYFDSNNTNFVGLDAPGVVPSSFTLTLPSNLPASDSFLTVSTTGLMSYGTAVSSVGLDLPSIFNVTGTPVTGSGTLTATLANQGQNLVFASPDGASGAPAFRGLVVADFSALPAVSDWAPATGDIDMGGNTITNLADPVNASDAVTKAYFDAMQQGIDPKESVDYYAVSDMGDPTAATQATIEAALDPVGGSAPTLSAGDRILVGNQADPIENGIYEWDGTSLTRAPDADGANLTAGAFTFVQEGDNFSGKGLVMIADDTYVTDTDPATWVQFSDAAAISDGDGLLLTGNTLSVQSADPANIVVNASGVNLAVTGVTPGVYNSFTVDAYGRITAATVENDTNSFFLNFVDANLTAGVLSVNHNLGNKYPTWTLADNLEQAFHPDNILFVDDNNLQVDLTNFAPLSGTYSLELQG